MRPALRSSFTPQLSEADPPPKRVRALFYVDPAKCVFTLQSLSSPHMFRDLPDAESGPIVVSVLSDGNYFVHNGRHRVIRARLDGEQMILAESLYEGDGTEPE